MSDAFDFGEGDRVLVRVREHGTSGPIQGKFIAEVDEFVTEAVSSDRVRLDPPWDGFATVALSPYDAEFEIVEEDDGGLYV